MFLSVLFFLSVIVYCFSFVSSGNSPLTLLIRLSCYYASTASSVYFVSSASLICCVFYVCSVTASSLYSVTAVAIKS